MANAQLFTSQAGPYIPPTDVRNNTGAPAYMFNPKHALAQYIATGALGGTYYATAREELNTVLVLASHVDSEFIAKAAIYSRERGAMKDMPALLCAWLSVAAPELLPAVFDRVIDNGRMLRNFVQIMRSGVVGRKSLGTRPKALVRKWLASRSDNAIFRASVGNSPSLADVLKMVHPKPETETREALYGWIIGRDVERTKLPPLVQEYERYKETREGPVPKVPFQMLTALDLSTKEWTEIARNAAWNMTRMNVNTFTRHGVFKNPEMMTLVAQRLGDSEAVRRSKAFPYQVLAACTSVAAGTPSKIANALQDALDISLENVPAIKGKVHLCVDVSGSMHWPVTGYRPGATSKVNCVDVAGLVAAAILRKNSDATVLAFQHELVPVKLNPRDSVFTNVEKLVSIGGGGTDISAPLVELNRRQETGDLVIYVSDNESWVDADDSRGTGLMREWNIFAKRNPGAKLVCMDLSPNFSTQAVEREDILNIGGFSDTVFELLDMFARGKLNDDHWVGVIEAVEMD